MMTTNQFNKKKGVYVNGNTGLSIGVVDLHKLNRWFCNRVVLYKNTSPIHPTCHSGTWSRSYRVRVKIKILFFLKNKNFGNLF
jgi:hypothetical protein